VSHPYPAPSDRIAHPPVWTDRRRPRRRRPPLALWIIAPVIATMIVIAMAALKHGDELQATPLPTPSILSPSTSPLPADADGWQACTELRQLGPADLNHDVNRQIGRLGQRSTNQDIAARSRDLDTSTRMAAIQDPIEGNIAISEAQIAMSDACDRAFGPTG